MPPNLRPLCSPAHGGTPQSVPKLSDRSSGSGSSACSQEPAEGEGLGCAFCPPLVLKTPALGDGSPAQTLAAHLCGLARGWLGSGLELCCALLTGGPPVVIRPGPPLLPLRAGYWGQVGLLRGPCLACGLLPGQWTPPIACSIVARGPFAEMVGAPPTSPSVRGPQGTQSRGVLRVPQSSGSHRRSPGHISVVGLARLWAFNGVLLTSRAGEVALRREG